jgi:hypothetical protein
MAVRLSRLAFVVLYEYLAFALAGLLACSVSDPRHSRGKPFEDSRGKERGSELSGLSTVSGGRLDVYEIIGYLPFDRYRTLGFSCLRYADLWNRWSVYYFFKFLKATIIWR